MIIDLLDTVEKSTAVLKKMVKKTQKNTAGASDIDKIHVQLYLDVEQFGTYFSQYNIDPTQFPPFQKLQEGVIIGKKVFKYFFIFNYLN